MKLRIFLILSFFYIYAVEVFGQTLRSTASDLNGRINAALGNIGKMQKNMLTQIQSVENLDFGISNDQRVLNMLLRLAATPGSNANQCKNHFFKDLDALTEAVRKITKPKIYSIAKDVNTQNSILTVIQKRLSGQALAQEIGACRKSPTKCSLRGSYERSVGNAEKFVRDYLNNYTSPQLTNTIASHPGPKPLSLLIQLNIIIPTEQCLG